MNPWTCSAIGLSALITMGAGLVGLMWLAIESRWKRWLGPILGVALASAIMAPLCWLLGSMICDAMGYR